MKISVQSGETVYDLGFEKGYRMIREAGFEAIDWNIDGLWNLEKVIKGDFSDSCLLEQPLEEVLQALQPELEAIRKNGLAITQAHAPFPAYYREYPALLDYSIPIYKKCILLCQAVGCKNLIIHGISLPLHGDVYDAQELEKLNMRLYTSLIPELRRTEVTVCLENLFMGGAGKFTEGICSDPHEAVSYIDRLNEAAGKKCFGLCLDVGHLNLLRKNIWLYTKTLGKRICALHIHDNNGDGDSHLAPFAGNVDWKLFCRSLREIGYEGDLSFETFNQTSLRRMEEDYIGVYLQLICQTGRIFRRKIQE